LPSEKFSFRIWGVVYPSHSVSLVFLPLVEDTFFFNSISSPLTVLLGPAGQRLPLFVFPVPTTNLENRTSRPLLTDSPPKLFLPLLHPGTRTFFPVTSRTFPSPRLPLGFPLTVVKVSVPGAVPPPRLPHSPCSPQVRRPVRLLLQQDQGQLISGFLTRPILNAAGKAVGFAPGVLSAVPLLPHRNGIPTRSPLVAFTLLFLTRLDTGSLLVPAI